MNHRRVASRRIPYIPVTVTVGSTLRLDAQAVVDTGYTGSVVVPEGTFENSGQPMQRVTLWLADGSSVVAPVYRGVLLIGATRLAPVAVTELGSETIVGLEVLDSFLLTLDHGHEIALEP